MIAFTYIIKKELYYLKKKLFYIPFLIAILSLVTIVPITSALAATDNNKTTTKEQSTSAKGKIIIKYTAPETDWDSATPEEKETLKEIGWELEDGVLVQYRSVPEEIEEAIKDGYLLPQDEEIEYQKHSTFEMHDGHNDEDDTIIVNGKKTEINDGRFDVEENPETIEVESDENNKETIKKDENGEYQVILEQNLNEIIGDMEDHEEHNDMDNNTPPIQTFAYGQTYKTGDWVHCNRFNGPKSNHKHLEKWKPQAIINFYHSDCDYGALRYCKSHKNCNQKYRAAYCSYKQGHSTKYHKH